MEVSISFSLVRKYRTRVEVIDNAKHTTEVTAVVKSFIVPAPPAVSLHFIEIIFCAFAAAQNESF